MSRKFKTGKGNRTNYIYYTAEGTRITIRPGEDDVTDADITLLHEMDDDEVDKQRREEYGAPVHLEAYFGGDGDPADDRNQYLLDDTYNPERVLLEAEEEAQHCSLLDRLSGAMEHLQPQQKALYRKVFVDQRTRTDVAAEQDVSEAAIRGCLRRIYNRLRKLL